MENTADESKTLLPTRNDIMTDFDDDTYLIKEDLKFTIRPKLPSLSDLSNIENSTKNNEIVNEKSNGRKLFNKNSVKKQLQFKVTEPVKENLEHRPSMSKSTINLHEQLNKLKSDELKKRRQSISQSKNLPNSNRGFFFSFSEFLKNINSFKASVYRVLERPTGRKGLIYRLFVFTIVVGSILTGVLTTVSSLNKWSFKLLFGYEIFVTCYFLLEFILRLWCVDQRSTYKGLSGRINFLSRPLQLMEMTLIIISILFLSAGTFIEHKQNQIYFQTTTLSALRFFQIFRFLYIDRQAQTWIILSKVIKQHRFELLSSVYIGVIILLFSSHLILFFEKPVSEEADDNHFLTYADAMYWSIITMATIGYGDRSPRTFAGKIVSTTLCIVGVAFWTLPGGIIGSGFALKVEQKNKKKQFNRLLPAAATLIQSWWRMKATLFISSSNVSCLIATVATFDISKPIYSTSLRRLKRHLDSVNSANEEMNSYFVGLDSPVEKNEKKSDKLLENNQVFTQKDFEFIENSETTENKHETRPKLIQNKPAYNPNNTIYQPSLTSSYSHTSEEESILMKLSPEHLIIIRTILLLKFFRAQQKFKLAFKPYDFKDVIEQYTQGNMDIMLKMKDLQRKIDQMNTNAISRAFTGDYLFNGSPPLERKHVQPSLMSNNKIPQVDLNRSNSNPGRVRRLLSLSQDVKDKQQKQYDLNTLNDKIGHIESELENLSLKLDKLLKMNVDKS